MMAILSSPVFITGCPNISQGPDKDCLEFAKKIFHEDFPDVEIHFLGEVPADEIKNYVIRDYWPDSNFTTHLYRYLAKDINEEIVIGIGVDKSGGFSSFYSLGDSYCCVKYREQYLENLDTFKPSYVSDGKLTAYYPIFLTCTPFEYDPAYLYICDEVRLYMVLPSSYIENPMLEKILKSLCTELNSSFKTEGELWSHSSIEMDVAILPQSQDAEIETIDSENFAQKEFTDGLLAYYRLNNRIGITDLKK